MSGLELFVLGAGFGLVFAFAYDYIWGDCRGNLVNAVKELGL